MSEKEKEYDELKEKSIKILQFIGTLADEEYETLRGWGLQYSFTGGYVRSENKEQLGAKRATEIKSAMMLLVKMA